MYVLKAIPMLLILMYEMNAGVICTETILEILKCTSLNKQISFKCGNIRNQVEN